MVTFSCTLHRVVKIIDYVTLCAIQNNLLIFIVWNISAPATSSKNLYKLSKIYPKFNQIFY